MLNFVKFYIKYGILVLVALFFTDIYTCKIRFVNDSKSAIFLSMADLGPTVLPTDALKNSDVHLNAENYIFQLLLPAHKGYIGLEKLGNDIRFDPNTLTKFGKLMKFSPNQKQTIHIYVQDNKTNNFIYQYRLREEYCAWVGNRIKFSDIISNNVNKGFLNNLSKVISKSTHNRFVVEKIKQP